MAYVLRHHRMEKGSEGKLRHSTRQATVVSAERPSLSVMRMTRRESEGSEERRTTPEP